MKTLILCCDGTNNQFGKQNTNVVRFYQALDRDPARNQALFYDAGVGTMAAPDLRTRLGRFLSRISALAFGSGLTDNIDEGIRFIMQQYEPGDRVCLFGFSRGAYTARAIAAFLYKCGLPERGAEHQLRYAMRIFRQELATNEGETELSREYRRTFGRPCPVHFLGLWDTVASIGWIYNSKKLPFTRMNPGVSVVRHAVALDERRCFYRQNLWTREPQPPEQNIREAWFPGVHSDVGGGYGEDESALSKLSLDWMIREAAEAGISFNAQEVRRLLEGGAVARPDWHRDRSHVSLKGAWWIAEVLPKKYYDYSSIPRRYRFKIPFGESRYVPRGCWLHRSVVERWRDVSTWRPDKLDAAVMDRLAQQTPPGELVRCV